MTDSFHIFAHKGVGGLSESWEGGYFKSFDSDKPTNVGKTRINHPPNHHFYRWYKPFPNGWCMALFFPHCWVKPRAHRCRPHVALQSPGSPGEAMAAWGNPINICAQQISRIDVSEKSTPNTFFEVAWNTTKAVLQCATFNRFISFHSISVLFSWLAFGNGRSRWPPAAGFVATLQPRDMDTRHDDKWW